VRAAEYVARPMGTNKRERQKAGHQARLAYEQRLQEQAARRRRALALGAVTAALALAVILGVVLIGRGDDEEETAATTTTTTAAPSLVPAPPGPGAAISGPTPCPPADGTAERTTDFEQAPPMCIDPARSYTARFLTSVGPIEVALDSTRTPETTNNFVVLARYGYYDGSAVFRADDSIDILQGGAPTTNSTSDPGPGYTIPDEGGRFAYQPGQLVMARTAQPNSSGAQFFFTTGPNASNLDSQGTYVVFGTTDEMGVSLLQQVQASATEDPSISYATPQPPMIVQRVEILER
jgi:cyclophilin family peptidyl-prolyl cis-trans isomerase